MIRKMYAGTVAAWLAAVVQHRHVAHHGKAIVDALGNQEANVGVQKAALNSASAAPHHAGVTIDGRQSRLVCRHNAGYSPQPRDVLSGKHCEYTQAWSACNKGYFRAYLPPAAIAKYSMRALDGIERCSEVFAIAAGFGMNRRVFFRYDWCRCRSCLAQLPRTPTAHVPAVPAAGRRGRPPIQAVRLASSVCRLSVAGWRLSVGWIEYTCTYLRAAVGTVLRRVPA